MACLWEPCPSAWLLNYRCLCSVQFSSVQLLSHVWLFGIPWTAARQASLSITKSQSLLKLISIKSVMPSNHLMLCCPLLLPPSIFPNIRVFSNESALWKDSDAGKGWRQEEKGDDRGWDGWMVSPTLWTWVWVSSWIWWWTGKPGVLQSMGSQSRTWLSNWTELKEILATYIDEILKALGHTQTKSPNKIIINKTENNINEIELLQGCDFI